MYRDMARDDGDILGPRTRDDASDSGDILGLRAPKAPRANSPAPGGAKTTDDEDALVDGSAPVGDSIFGDLDPASLI